jgi:hypothetical protein
MPVTEARGILQDREDVTGEASAAGRKLTALCPLGLGVFPGASHATVWQGGDPSRRVKE